MQCRTRSASNAGVLAAKSHPMLCSSNRETGVGDHMPGALFRIVELRLARISVSSDMMIVSACIFLGRQWLIGVCRPHPSLSKSHEIILTHKNRGPNEGTFSRPDTCFSRENASSVFDKFIKPSNKGTLLSADYTSCRPNASATRCCQTGNAADPRHRIEHGRLT